MTGVNGTLFVSEHGEELVEPDECKVRVTITTGWRLKEFSQFLKSGSLNAAWRVFTMA